MAGIAGGSDGQVPRWALVISYNGSGFAGFQSQVEGRTVQREIVEALRKLNLSGLRLIAAGRTDAGVHAERQVVTLAGSIPMPADELRRALNSLLPADIRVVWARPAPAWFDARRSVLSRVYRYRLANPSAPHPVVGDAAWSRLPVDINDWRDKLKSLIGVRDFAAYATDVLRSGKSTVRQLIRADCWREGNEIVIELEANSFLTRMVRLIVGWLIKSSGYGVAGASVDSTATGEWTKKRWPAEAKGLTFYGVTAPGLAIRGVNR